MHLVVRRPDVPVGGGSPGRGPQAEVERTGRLEELYMHYLTRRCSLATGSPIAIEVARRTEGGAGSERAQDDEALHLGSWEMCGAS